MFYTASACIIRVHATLRTKLSTHSFQVIRREAADAASEAESWARELRRELEDARDGHEASADAREGGDIQ